MPKKTRRMKQRASLRRDEGIEAPEAGVEEAGETVVARPVFGNRNANTPLTFDYSHLYNDLKRIAMFVVFFTVVLIALSFIIK
jgi:hypothetical protein